MKRVHRNYKAWPGSKQCVLMKQCKQLGRYNKRNNDRVGCFCYYSPLDRYENNDHTKSDFKIVKIRKG